MYLHKKTGLFIKNYFYKPNTNYHRLNYFFGPDGERLEYVWARNGKQ